MAAGWGRGLGQQPRRRTWGQSLAAKKKVADSRQVRLIVRKVYYDEQSCSSMKTFAIPLAPSDMSSYMPPGDRLWEPEAQGFVKAGKGESDRSGSQDRKLVSHFSNCPKQEEGKEGEPTRSFVQTLPQSLFISPFELPVSSESQEENDHTGTPSALTLKTVLLSAPREVDFVGLEQFQLAEKLLVRLDLDWRSFQVENFDDSVLMGGFEDLETSVFESNIVPLVITDHMTELVSISDALTPLAGSCRVPYVLKSCAEFIETHGIVDGIYRLSGVTSNIQRLRQEFVSDQCPDLTREVYLQDIHCVGSLCKLYFRELPNPLLTYELYKKFTEAVSRFPEDEQLARIQNVIQELPPSHYRTLEYLIKHLTHLASFSNMTNMHTRNLALVWAPNLLRSKEIEAVGCNGDAAFLEVRVQQLVIEFILNHVDQIFNKNRKASSPESIGSNLTEPLTMSLAM
ncbi:hypothetical protein TURU_032047 [Turdus rufiventris]|nr:hypothetical protein TURU_032047 [Turdus rufiventris]